MPSFCVKVYGCQMNVYDADRVRTVLCSCGWEEVNDESQADVVMITGCSVRAKAEQKVWSELGLYDPSWQKNHRPLVALTGCIAQRIGERALARFPYVRLVAGPRHIGLLPDAIAQIVSRPSSRISLLDTDPREFHSLELCQDVTIKRENKYKAYVTIAHGCDNFCTYCIVPYVRGRFVSRSPDEILEECRMLIADGVKEITLLGQNVNSYGKDIGLKFSGLLREVARLEGIERVRFVTSLPQDFTEDIADVMAEEKTVCPSLNLPIQSGSTRVLRLMNRKYTREDYFDKVRMLRERVPDVALTTDIITGFPGETDEDFAESLSALQEIRFDLVHSAAYSEREGTPAATMPGALPQEVRLSRLNTLNALQDSITLEINRALEGQVFEVLADDFAPKGGHGSLQGRTPGDKVVIFDGSTKLLGEFVKVRITRAEAWCLHGEVVQ